MLLQWRKRESYFLIYGHWMDNHPRKGEEGPKNKLTEGTAALQPSWAQKRMMHKFSLKKKKKKK